MTGTALPPYTVRVSDRARHVRLTVTPRYGLVVVVPRGWRGAAAEIVASKREWAWRALSQVAGHRQAHLAGPDGLLPAAIDLRMTGESLVVEYVDGVSGQCRATRTLGGLRVTGTVDSAARLAAVSRWLDREARVLLPARASELAAAHGFSPSGVRVARARSRWGSCSAHGSVSLNRTLVFLPSHLVDALILHEFTHLRVMNHSARFWGELQRLDPAALSHRGELRDAATTLVPAWAEY